MENLLETIRIAITPAATEEARAAGASACRAILTALDATLGEALVPAAEAQSNPVASAVAMLRGVPPEQLLDMAIARLRAALPAGAEAPRVDPLKFHIIQLPRITP